MHALAVNPRACDVVRALRQLGKLSRNRHRIVGIVEHEASRTCRPWRLSSRLSY